MLALTFPTSLGGRGGMTIVSGDSMLPTYHGDDLVVTWHEDRYEPGTIVVYRIPSDEVGSGINIVHRIVERKDGGYVTQGDNNRTIDPWTPTEANIQGRALFHLPHGGFVLRWFLSPLILATLCGVLVTLSVLSAARRRRAGPRGGPETPGEPGAGGPEQSDVQEPEQRPHGARGGRALLLAALVTALAVALWGASTSAAATLGAVTSDQLFTHTEPVTIDMHRAGAHQVSDTACRAMSTGSRTRGPAPRTGMPARSGQSRDETAQKPGKAALSRSSRPASASTPDGVWSASRRP
ncbi:MAG: peptidase signal peptidase [Nocardioides sp.]|nr:peptidase signal peptidase [Nocardioides sp.]